MAIKAQVEQQSVTAKFRLNNSLKLAFSFQLAWVVIAGICIAIGRPIAIELLAFNLVTLFAPALLEVLTRTKLPIALQVHFFVFVTSASLLGSIVGFYGLVPNWDTYVHLDSGVLMTWLGLFVVREAESQSKARLPKWFALATAFAVTMALAAMWEIYEFFSDVLIHTNMQIGGLEDTMIDTIAAVVGALIAIVIALWLKAPKSVLPKSLH